MIDKAFQSKFENIISMQFSNTSAASFILVSIWSHQPHPVFIPAVLWIVQVESSRDAQTQALQELSAKLQQEYEEKLQEEQQKHREEIEKLQVCTPNSSTLTIAHHIQLNSIPVHTKSYVW